MAKTAEEGINTLAADSIADEPAVSDSLENESGLSLNYGISLTPPVKEVPTYTERPSNAMSWIVLCLILVFVAACLRYRKNTRYFVAIFNDMMEVRERSHAFDGTVRESSFLLLLNLLWCISTGVLLYALVSRYAFHTPIEVWSSANVAGVGICMAVALGYTLFLIIAYGMVGNVFADGPKTSMWVKGFLASQAMDGIVMFPLAIIGLVVPSALGFLLILGAFAYFLAKIVFIYKGFCIFFSKSSSWVLFLYYLCSLEIVPLVVAYATASKLSPLP